MNIKNKFQVGEIVFDTLGNYKCIIRSIEKDCLILSRLDKIESKYSQIPRYIKK
jgi:hypothetical protein